MDKCKDQPIEQIKQKIIILSEEIENREREIEEREEKLKKLISDFSIRRAKDFISLNTLENSDSYWDTIKSFNFSQYYDNSWKCKYIHIINNYTNNNYCINEESEDEELIPCFKQTKICFGYTNNKYFIYDNSSDNVNVYTHNKLPYIYNPEYENICEIDSDDIMEIYSKNINIPEWLMIRFFIQINRHKYYPIKLKKYFDIV